MLTTVSIKTVMFALAMTLGAGLMLVMVPSIASASDLELTSPAFEDNHKLPRQFSRSGGNQSPPLVWTGLPEGTRSLALICDDPDAPGKTWVHWVIYNIPATLNGLEQGLADDEQLPGIGTQGENSWNAIGYDGPQPPSGTHRYYFRLYALDADLALEPGLTKRELLDAIDDHILDDTKLMGKFSH